MALKTNVLDESWSRNCLIQSGNITSVTAADTMATPYRLGVLFAACTKASDGSAVAVTVSTSTGLLTFGTGPSNETVKLFLYGRPN